MTPRREARERALGLLYEAEMKGIAPAELLDELPVAPDPFAAAEVAGVGRCVAQLDAVIGTHSVAWAVDRMPAVDRALLRMAVWELIERPDIPTGAVISEAVELAKAYSTEESGRFVNGVLGSIATEVRADVPAEARADVPADVPTEARADVPAEARADVAADVPAEARADVPADVPVDGVESAS